MTCHIEHDEELQLLEHCILSTDDPRFNEEIHSAYDITLTNNRALYLRALVAGEKTALCSVVPRIKDSGWPYKMDMTALSAMPENWRGLSLKYLYSFEHLHIFGNSLMHVAMPHQWHYQDKCYSTPSTNSGADKRT